MARCQVPPWFGCRPWYDHAPRWSYHDRIRSRTRLENPRHSHDRRAARDGGHTVMTMSVQCVGRDNDQQKDKIMPTLGT